jgi:hypothetical protein
VSTRIPHHIPRALLVHKACRALLFALAAIVVAAPGLVYAQQTMNAQPLTPQSLALTATDLGPEWTASAQNTEVLEGGTPIYTVIYRSPSGRSVRITTAVATSVDLAEGVISYLRYELDRQGMTITSVQNNGFGDGRAFKAELSDGQRTMVSYLFRVRNLTAFVDYVGSANSDVQQQALALARKQEAKLFAAFAPPPAPVAATPTPAPAPAPAPTPAPTPAPVVTAPAAPPAPVAQAEPAAPYCRAGEGPQFRFGFATLSDRLGGLMGNPTSCEYGDPSGSGDTLQNTDKGLSFYRKSTNTSTFTNGSQHWALTPAGIVAWTGDSIEPTADAQPFEA